MRKTLLSSRGDLGIKLSDLTCKKSKANYSIAPAFRVFSKGKIMLQKLSKKTRDNTNIWSLINRMVIIWHESNDNSSEINQVAKKMVHSSQ